DPRSVGPLCEVLRDPDNDVREAAIEALALLRDPAAVEHLVVTLADTQTSVRNAAGAALRKIDSEWQFSEAARRAIPTLKSALTNKEYWVRQAAADVLSKISDVRKSEPSLQAFTDPVCYKRNMAVDALLQALGDWDRDLRLAAVEALGRI